MLAITLQELLVIVGNSVSDSDARLVGEWLKF